MRRILAVVAGLVVANALYFASVVAVLQPIQHASGASPEEWLGPAFHLLMPLCQLAGGLVTGFLSRTIPSPRWPLAALHSPGLYTFLVGVPFLIGTIAGFQVFMFIAGILWVIGSTLGVLLGSRRYARRTSAP